MNHAVSPFLSKKKTTIASVFAQFIFFLPFQLIAQQSDKYSEKNWQLMDFAKDSVYGTSVNKAYEGLLKGKVKHRVIVAVIDGGLDTAQEDLQGHVWTNKKEIAGNGIDDDQNGYVDDIHGWNFLGGKDGRYIENESYEVDREYYRLHNLYSLVIDSSKVEATKINEYNFWLKLKQTRVKDSSESLLDIAYVLGNLSTIKTIDSTWRKILRKDTLTIKDVRNGIAAGQITKPATDSISKVFINLITKRHIPDNVLLSELLVGGNEFVNNQKKKLQQYSIDPNAARRDIVGDDPFNINDTNYGNNNIIAGTPSHGTHVSGIIAAIRKNSIGMDGIADNVLIIPVRAAPEGDERDKDVALAIRYAVNNGAKIINMSFGKPYSPGKKWVDDAVKYAAQKDVLIIHAAGNASKDIDTADDFPNPVFLGTTTKAPNFITVGASTGGPDIAQLQLLFLIMATIRSTFLLPAKMYIRLYLEINIKLLVEPVWLHPLLPA